MPPHPFSHHATRGLYLLLLVILSPLVGAAGLKFWYGHDEDAFDSAPTYRDPVRPRGLLLHRVLFRCKLRNSFLTAKLPFREIGYLLSK
jgi:hypothetical protein